VNDTLSRRFEEIEVLARKMGLDPFPVVFEEVPREIIWDIASYGLPTRMSHWSFGRSFVHQKTYGEMGYSKIYELIVNNDPSYAFLDDTNSDVADLLIAAHCYGHSDFFKNNTCFSRTNRNMVNQAERNARTIDQYKTTYGVDAVEDWMDVAFSLDNHLDVKMGENRVKYPEPQHVFREISPLPYAELFGEESKKRVVDEVRNTELPPHPERDILWFLINYAQMLPWQREVFSIIRSESYYFQPQMLTKIMNEGWASFWHAELILNYNSSSGNGLTPEEHLDFSKAHSGVVNPGFKQKVIRPDGKIEYIGLGFNPYYVGFRIFGNIKKRWDEYYEAGKKDAAFQRSDEVDHYDSKDDKVVMSKMTGMQKIRQVMVEDDDISFITGFLTRELSEDMELFTYGYRGVSENPDEDDIIIKDRELDVIQRAITEKLHNNGVPIIWISKADDKGLHLKHDPADKMPLDDKYAEETVTYIYKVWKKPVFLETHDRFGSPKTIVHDEGGAKVATQKDGAVTVEI
jgi:stage V sporulation protein R